MVAPFPSSEADFSRLDDGAWRVPARACPAVPVSARDMSQGLVESLWLMTVRVQWRYSNNCLQSSRQESKHDMTKTFMVAGTSFVRVSRIIKVGAGHPHLCSVSAH